MKLILLLSLSLILSNDRPQWVNDIDILIKQLTYDENNPTKESFINSKKYSSFHLKKLSFEPWSVDASFYFKKSTIIKAEAYYINFFMYKRKRRKEEVIGKLTREMVYFSSKSNGIKYVQEIDVYETDDLTLLKKELDTIKHIKSDIDKDDYKKTKQFYKIFKKIKKEIKKEPRKN